MPTKFSAVIALMPRQLVNDRPIEAIVGSQMKPMHRMVGMPTISAIVTLSVAVRRSSVMRSPMLLRARRRDFAEDATAPPATGGAARVSTVWSDMRSG